MTAPATQGVGRAKPVIAGLFDTVVRGGFCIGCGACAALHPGIGVTKDETGRFVAVQTGSAAGSPEGMQPASVCPFAEDNPNEDELAREQFGRNLTQDAHLGFHAATYAGWVTEGDFRAEGSSGGIASWLLIELLNRALVDYVVHVAPCESADRAMPLFRYVTSRTAAEVRAGAKSRYYPVEMSGVISEMLRQPGRYVVVGIPCFAKALRLACRQSPLLRQRVAFTVGIVCGHLKSAAFAEMYAWQCGIAPGDLRSVDFRTKLPGRPASDYGVTVAGSKLGVPVTVTTPTSKVYGGNWGYGFFKYKACDFCDDVVGETADVSVGDAWLPEYESDSRGTNIVVVRSPVLHSLLEEGASQRRLHLDRLPVEKVVASQAGGFRHRRDGLAYRLWAEDQAARWRPPKRVQPSADHLSKQQRQVFDLRSKLAEQSHTAFLAAKRAGDFSVFVNRMSPFTRAYDKLYRPSLWRRALSKLKRLALRLLGRR